ncbi:MAG: hypothetical protein ACI9G1_000270 [Pirellulaceae bacterium]|jgi:hypothetical protein
MLASFIVVLDPTPLACRTIQFRNIQCHTTVNGCTVSPMDCFSDPFKSCDMCSLRFGLLIGILSVGFISEIERPLTVSFWDGNYLFGA